MMKFFRRHNKKLLAVFMVLLMVVFIGGTALESLFQPQSNRAVATSRLGDITDRDQQLATATTSVLERLGIDWRHPAPGVREPLTLIDWILLSKEASTLGVPSRDEALKAWFGGASGEDRVSRLARQARLKPAQIWHALGQFRSLQLATLAIGSTWSPSTAEVRSAARKVLDKVQVNAVVFPATAFLARNEEFTESELQEQFQTYRDAIPGDGLEFGYFVPPAVTVQYVMIHRDKLAELVGVANEEKKAKRYYDENRVTDAAFKRPAGDPASTQALVGPTEAEVAPYLDWDEAKEAAIAIVRGRVADDVSERMAVWLMDQAGDAWLEMERGDDRYRKIPESARNLGQYTTLVANFPASLAYPKAVSVLTTAPFTRDQAASLEHLGEAAFRPTRGARKSFESIAFRNQTVIPKVPEDAGAAGADYTARFQTSPYMMRDDDGNTFVFRVIDSVPAHVPESVDEVLDRLKTDLRLLHGYEEAIARAEGIRSCEGGKTLQEAYDSDEELSILADIEDTGGLGYFQSSLVPRLRFYEVGSGQTSDTVYVGIGARKVPRSFVEEWFALEGDQPTIMELRDQAAVLVVEWQHTEHGDEAAFQEMRGRLTSSLLASRSRDAMTDWLAPDNIRARNEFELIRSR